jgi:deoxyribonuclease V
MADITRDCQFGDTIPHRLAICWTALGAALPKSTAEYGFLMAKVRDLHTWDLSYAEARALQSRLADRVRLTALRKRPRLIAGLDCAFSRDGKRIFAAAVVLAVDSDEVSGTFSKPPKKGTRHPPFVVETATAEQESHFPYVPGLLSFREAPVCLEAVRRLSVQPDAFLIDGQGIAHPRRLGLAAHLGLFVDRPTVGCAKSRLIGEFVAPGAEKGAHRPLCDGDEVIGAVVRTRADVKPLFVSVGHRCCLDDAIDLTLACATKYRLPEPTRLAHRAVSEAKCREA